MFSFEFFRLIFVCFRLSIFIVLLGFVVVVLVLFRVVMFLLHKTKLSYRVAETPSENLEEAQAKILSPTRS